MRTIVLLTIQILFFASANKTFSHPNQQKKINQVSRSILYLNQISKHRVSIDRVRSLAAWFVKYSEKWDVDVWLVVAVAYQESIFKDRPQKIKVKRCETKFRQGIAIQHCKYIWPGEIGIMQIIPAYAHKSFKICTGKTLSHENKDDLYDSETNICVGVHLLSKRRRKVKTRAKNKGFITTGAERTSKWRKKHAPCSKRQKKFCQKNRKACDKYWWVASWNWGTHRIICGNTSRPHDFQGYPIKIIRRRERLANKYGKKEVQELHADYGRQQNNSDACLSHMK